MTLEEQLAALATQRDTENADLLQQLQGNFLASQQAAAATPQVTSGFQNFVDAATGSNFSRSAEALVNQRALLATGNDPASQAFRQQLASEQALQQSDNISPGQQLQTQLQLDSQRRAEERAQLKAEMDAAKLAQKQQENEFKAQLAIRDEDRKNRLAEAKIRQGDERNQIARTRPSGSNDPLRNQLRQLQLETGQRKLADLKKKEFEVPKKEREAIDERSGVISNLLNTSDLFNTDKAKLAFSLSARGTEFLPGTSEQFLLGGVGRAARARANIKSEINTQVQKVATILEGGKLAEGDIKRYRELLPSPKDSIEVAQEKMATLIETMKRDQIRDVETQKARGKDTSIFAFGLEQTGITLPSSQKEQQTQTAQGFDPDALLDELGL